MHAELAYVFRHALLRAAAYELQLPEDRARLHALALHGLELALADMPQALDAAARELADHAALGAPADAALGAREVHWLLRAARHARAGYRHDAEAECLQRVVGHAAATPAQQRDALEDLAHNRARLGRSLEAIGLFDRVHDAARDAGDTRMELAAMTGKGQALRHLRDFEAAQAILAAAEARAQQVGDITKLATARVMLGVLHEAQGRTAEAANLYALALQDARACGDRKSEELALGNRANIHLVALEHETALSLYTQALAIAIERNDPRTQAIWTGNLGLLNGKLGRLAVAEQMLERSIELARQAGDLRNEATMLLNLCAGLIDTDRWPQCGPRAARALDLAREMQNRALEAAALEYQGRVAMRQGDFAEAARVLAHARQAALASKHPREIGISTGLYAVALKGTGSTPPVNKLLQEALACSRQAGDREHEALWLTELAVLARETGDEAAATAHWESARTALQKYGDEALTARVNARFAAARPA